MSLSGSRHGDPLVVASKTLCRRRLKNALNDSVLKNIFTYTSQAGSVIPVGTCFFLGHDPKEDAPTVSPRVYAVTARHVVDKLRKLGRRDLTLRLNRRDPAADVMPITIPLDEWFVHPSDASIDVAIRETAVPPEVDHVVVPMKMCTTQTTFAENEVELGDEVFISGLFRHHYGKRRNVPIIRVGNLAALDDEKVVTDFGEFNAILIEARSIGGLSGSPVFLNLGSVRTLGGQIIHSMGKYPIFLLGLVHGHFDTPAGIDTQVEGDNSRVAEKINAGIAIVVPIGKVWEVVQAYEATDEGRRRRPA
jgi:hypothetical protein